MGPLLVVEGQISPNPLSGLSPFWYAFRYTSSYLMLRHSRSTKTLSMHRPLAVHAHLNALRQQHGPDATDTKTCGTLGRLIWMQRTETVAYPSWFGVASSLVWLRTA